ncbi:MAG: hypothetical protein KGI27_13390 [Thaumarchaeota archaeon]|nr:hypothetical protein [Nitrososphaerota archaeon]
MTKYYLYCGIYYTYPSFHIESLAKATAGIATALSLRARFQANAKFYCWLGTEKMAEEFRKLMKHKDQSKCKDMFIDGRTLFKMKYDEIKKGIEDERVLNNLLKM